MAKTAAAARITPSGICMHGLAFAGVVGGIYRRTELLVFKSHGGDRGGDVIPKRIPSDFLHAREVLRRIFSSLKLFTR